MFLAKWFRLGQDFVYSRNLGWKAKKVVELG